MKNRRLISIIKLGLQLIIILSSFAVVIAQDDENYTIVGRIIDENGKPSTDAEIMVEPVSYKSKSFERFIEGVGTDAEGRFRKKIPKNKFSFGENYFVFVTLDNNLQALTTVDPPFDWIRKYDKTFNGKNIKLGKQSLIDVGDIKIQFRYGQANLNFAYYRRIRRLDHIDWHSLHLRIRNKNGFRVYESSLSRDDVEKYVDTEKSELNISLPEGKWKVEIILNNEKIGKTNYFEIKRDKSPVDLIVKHPNRNRLDYLSRWVKRK